MRLLAASVIILACAATAAAQGPYVGGSIISDIVRVSGGTNDVLRGNGETIGGAVRAGTALGEQWGVDLEFARSGEIEGRPEVNILAGEGRFVFGSGSVAIFPPPEIVTTQQISTLTSALWWRQHVSERLQMVYLGGVVFSRQEREFRASFSPRILPPIFPDRLILPPRVLEDESVVYEVGVSVGIDASVGITERLRVVPGARLLNAVPDGWVIRPAVGIQWLF